MELKIYNTLSRSIEVFKPIDANNVKIYSCGPTVYWNPHIGNLRKYFIDDLLKNTIRYILWYKTTHVINITDVWHLVSDADDGEDKMEKGAKREWISAWDLALKYEAYFVDNLKTLRIELPDFLPRATDHIAEQIAMIEKLEKNGFTYTVEGDGIYMDTSKMENYGALVWKKHLEWLQSGSRIDLKWKKNITDFALWKFNMTGKKREMERDSPRWIGFPGRHIECSAMSTKYLWDQFDIHTGGIDHVPIHHTNEIAQSECSGCKTPWVHYRVHTQFLNINNAKISKSDWNLVLLSEVIEKGYSPEDMRYFYLQAHYRSFQDFTREALEAAKKGRQSLIKKIKEGLRPSQEEEQEIIWELLNDLNTWWMLGKIHSFWCPAQLDDHILKLWLFEEEEKIEAPAGIQALAEQRRKAKSDKNRALADELRNKLQEWGRNMKDWKDNYELLPL
jgi:cysteinyl-tRNA synthetase